MQHAFPRGALALWFLSACASTQPSPFTGQPPRLSLGVDKDEEAHAVQQSFERRGYRLARRIDGEGFVALAFDDAEGKPKAVRVVTLRGIALALSSVDASPLAQGVTYGLATLPEVAEGIWVLETRAAEGACVRFFRVLSTGMVEEQESAPDATDPGIDTCVAPDNEG